MSNGFGINIAALRVSRRLNDTARIQQTAMERLGSGMRINRASDDAAGLSIAASLKADARIYSQAIRNVNDGISAITIASAAIDQLTEIVTRQMELAQQAANGSYSPRQRAAMDKEARALTDEYNRIGSTTTFNGINLFTSSTSIQASVGEASVITITPGSVISDDIGIGTFEAAVTTSSGSSVTRQASSADLNGDGHDDIVTGNWTDGDITILLSNGDGTFAGPTQYSVGGNASLIELADLNHDGALDVVTRGYDGANTAVAVLLGRGDGTFNSSQYYSVGTSGFYDFELADFNNDGNLDFIGSHSTLGIGNGIAVYFGRSDGSFGSLYTMGTYRAGLFHTGDFNGDNQTDFLAYDYGAGNTKLFLGNGDGTFSVNNTGYGYGYDVTDLNRDGYTDVIRFTTTSTLGVFYGSSSGTFTAGATMSLTNATMYNVEAYDLNSDGFSDLITYGDGGTSANIIFGASDGTFSAAQGFTVQASTYDVTVGDVTGDGASDIIFASLNASGIQIFEQNGVAAVNQAHINLLSMQDARTSLDSLQGQLEGLSQQSAILGAQQSRLTTVTNVLQSLRDNYIAAESRITDVDVAVEASQLIRTSILNQVASMVMAQAKSSQYLLLDLLRD